MYTKAQPLLQCQQKLLVLDQMDHHVVALPENPHDSEELRDSPDLRELPHVRRVDEGDADEVRQDGQQVNDVHRALHELELARRGDQSYLRSYTSLFFIVVFLLYLQCHAIHMILMIIWHLLKSYQKLKGEPRHIDRLE